MTRPAIELDDVWISAAILTLSYQAAVARMSALTRVQARAAHPRKEYPAKVRGKKAGKTGGGAKKEDEDVIELD